MPHIREQVIKMLHIFLRLILGPLIVLGLAVVGASAAVFTVTTTNDSGPGSLRQAIANSNNNNQEDTVAFDPVFFSTARTIVLGGSELVIDADNSSGSAKQVTIMGPGASLLTVSGNMQSRVFEIEFGAHVSIEGMRVTAGNGVGALASGNGGGLLVQAGGIVTLKRILVDNNVIPLGNNGGGLLNFGSKLSIIDSAMVNNSAGFAGGAISSRSAAGVLIVNSTISGNQARTGAGIKHDNGPMELMNCTIAYNRASDVTDAGGILLDWDSQSNPSLLPRNTIITNNTSSGGAPSDYNNSFLIVSRGNNLFGGTIPNPGPGDNLNVNARLDPVLGPNGGELPTHALLVDSPGVDGGNNCVLMTPMNGGCSDPAVTTDLRGVLRPQDGDQNGTATVDIGSYELASGGTINTPAMPDLLPSSDSGVSSSDNITLHRNLAIDVGGVINGATVELYRNGVIISSVVASGTSVLFTDNDRPADSTNAYRARQIVASSTSFLSAELVVIVDNTGATVTVNQAPGQADPTRFQPINFRVTFSETVVGFSISDIDLSSSTADVSNASVGINGTGSLFTVNIGNVQSDGNVIARVIGSAAEDLAGNPSVASTSTDNGVTLDTTAPSVTINQAAGQADPTRFQPINFTVVFSEAVTGLSNSDISLAGSTANVSFATRTVTGSGANYNIAINGATSNGGHVVASIPPLAVQDAAGNTNIASISTDNSVLLDNVGPSVTVNQSVGQPDPASNQPVSFTAVFNESVTGFQAIDISLAGSTANVSSANVSVTGMGTTYTILISGVTSNGRIVVSVPAGGVQDAIGNPNQASTSSDNGVTIVVEPSATFDFDGDGKTDIGIFRPIAGASEWWINRSGNGQTFALQFGSSTDRIAPADYTGDGKSDIAFFRPSSGEWYVLRSEDFSFFALPFGTKGDVPVPADYDADGKADFAVFRPSSATWFISQSSGAPTRIEQFGAAGDVPVVADYDGDGKADVGIFRQNGAVAEWWVNRSTAGSLALQFGASTDKAVPGDYTGDGKADIAIWRPSDGNWLILRSEDFSFFGFPFGANGDVPSPGDYDGDGKFDPTVFRPSSATWFIGRTTAGTQIVQFGATGDRPIPNAFVP